MFEGVFDVPNGISFNSYLLRDEKTVLFDTTDAAVRRTFGKISSMRWRGGRWTTWWYTTWTGSHGGAGGAGAALPGGADLLQRYGQDHDDPVLRHRPSGAHPCGEGGDTLCTGRHTLRLLAAPMVHWPEVMMTYESSEKLLFSADAFGSFGATGGNLFNDELNFDRDWPGRRPPLLRQYRGQVRPPGAGRAEEALRTGHCHDLPLHGPIWRSNLDYLLDKYDKWSRYEPEERAVAVLYASMYGDTENAVNLLAAGLADSGVKNIAMHDISSTHVSTLISEVFRCSHLVLAAPTYNNGVYPRHGHLPP